MAKPMICAGFSAMAASVTKTASAEMDRMAPIRWLMALKYSLLSGAEMTLPKWIYNAIRLPRNRPVANAVALIVIVLSLIPVYFAQRLAGAGDTATSSAGPAVGARP